jgi:hypothetical protein
MVTERNPLGNAHRLRGGEGGERLRHSLRTPSDRAVRGIRRALPRVQGGRPWGEQARAHEHPPGRQQSRCLAGGVGRGEAGWKINTRH